MDKSRNASGAFPYAFSEMTNVSWELKAGFPGVHHRGTRVKDQDAQQLSPFLPKGDGALAEHSARVQARDLQFKVGVTVQEAFLLGYTGD